MVRIVAIVLLVAIVAAAVMAASESGSATGAVERVNVSTQGVQADSSGGTPHITPDGRFVLFGSRATNLAPNTPTVPDEGNLFLRDRQYNTTELVPGGSQGVRHGAISDDGRFVAFVAGGDLLPSDTNGLWDVYVWDRQTDDLDHVNVSTGGQGASGEQAQYTSPMDISGDGRFVVFASGNASLVSQPDHSFCIATPAYCTHIYLRDRLLGTTERIDRQYTDQGAPFGFSRNPVISADGRYTAYSSTAKLIGVGDTDNFEDIFVFDSVTGQTMQASLADNEGQSSSPAIMPSISADGRYVGFSSEGNDFVSGDTNLVRDIFVRDMATGSTARVSVSAGGAQGNNYVFYESQVSGAGRFVTFTSLATNLVPGDTNSPGGVFVRDRDSDADGTLDEPGAVSTTRVTLTADDQPVSGSYGELAPAGGVVVFGSEATNLVPNDTNGLWDNFVREVTFPGAGLEPTPTPSPPAGPPVTVSVDTDGGNGTTSVGQITSCRAVTLGQVFTVDVVVQGVPAPGIRGFSFNTLFDPAVLKLNGLAASAVFIVAADGNGPITHYYSSFPDVDGDYYLHVYDGSGINETGDGLLIRFEFQALGSGTSTIVASDTAGQFSDGLPNIQMQDQGLVFLYPSVNTNAATIVVGGSCGGPTPTPPPPLPGDMDGDGVLDGSDNCPNAANPVQQNSDGDVVGDACDNCVYQNNANQANADGDARGDACDNCPTTASASQTSSDSDFWGDPCDNCPTKSNITQVNSDGDGLGDACDNCTLVANQNQANQDNDATGDACEPVQCWTVNNWWFSPEDDIDCDGFTGDIEALLGTSEADGCANTSAVNDEADDKWPADQNDNRLVNTLDMVIYAVALNTMSGGPGYSSRADLNQNGVINTLDLVPYATMLGRPCGP